MQKIVPDHKTLQSRTKWRFRGQERPDFAEVPRPGQRSVWEFPRPPRIVPVSAPLKVDQEGRPVAQTRRGFAVEETAGAPTYYFPPDDVDQSMLRRTGRSYHCEWKGVSDEVSVGPVVPRAGC